MPRITEVLLKPTGSRRVMVGFEHGKIQPQYLNNIKGQMYRSTQNESIVGVTTESMLYTGQVKDDDMYNNFIMVHDKENLTVRLLQVDHCITSPLVYKQKQNILKSPAKSDRLSTVSDLHKQFGSKATKRLTEQRERLTMNIDAVKDQLEKTVSDVKINESVVDQTFDENTSMYRPKINRNATSVDDVYDLEDLVPSHILDTLNEEALSVIETKDLSKFGTFASTNIGAILRSNASEDATKRSITIHLYINYLIKFMHTPVRQLTKKYVACPSSMEVSNHIMETFSINSPTGRTRPIHMKDKSLCYVLVLTSKTMTEVDLGSLAKDCKVGVKKALEISRMLAFSSSTKDKNIVMLKLPLPSPVTFPTKKKMKRQ